MSATQGKPRKKARGAFHNGELREALIAAAHDLVRRRGAEAVSLRPLARRLNVSQPALYRHFRSKEALLAAVANRVMGDFTAVLDGAMRGHPDPFDALAATARAYVRWAHQHPNEFRVWSSRMVNDERPRLPPLPREHYFERMARTVPLDDPALPDAFRATWAFSHGLAVLVVERVFQMVDDDAGRLAAADAAIDVQVSMVKARWPPKK